MESSKREEELKTTNTVDPERQQQVVKDTTDPVEELSKIDREATMTFDEFKDKFIKSLGHKKELHHVHEAQVVATAAPEKDNSRQGTKDHIKMSLDELYDELKRETALHKDEAVAKEISENEAAVAKKSSENKAAKKELVFHDNSVSDLSKEDEDKKFIEQKKRELAKLLREIQADSQSQEDRIIYFGREAANKKSDAAAKEAETKSVPAKKSEPTPEDIFNKAFRESMSELQAASSQEEKKAAEIEHKKEIIKDFLVNFAKAIKEADSGKTAKRSETVKTSVPAKKESTGSHDTVREKYASELQDAASKKDISVDETLKTISDKDIKEKLKSIIDGFDFKDTNSRQKRQDTFVKAGRP